MGAFREMIEREKADGEEFHLVEGLLGPLEKWFENSPFQGPLSCIKGTRTLTIKVEGDEGYLIRASYKGDEPRGLAPYMVQPLAFKSQEIDGIVMLEILPKLGKQYVLPEYDVIAGPHSKAPKPNKAIEEFKAQTKKSGYFVTRGFPELREFTFKETSRKFPFQRRIATKTVPMLVDPGEIEIPANHPPICEEGYPTLENQLELQRELVARYPKLKEYLRTQHMELPEHAPKTFVNKSERFLGL